jgi:hypothetical protein
MISDEFRFRTFAEIAKGKAHHEIIYLAEQEALEAWRMAHPSKGLAPAERSRSLEYQQKLLGLIAYLRHGVLGRSCDERVEDLFRLIRTETAPDNVAGSRMAS